MTGPHIVIPSKHSVLDGSKYLIPTLYGADGNPIYAANSWFRYLVNVKRFKADTTVTQYAHTLLTFFKFLNQFKVGSSERDWTRTTNAVVRLWRASLEKRNDHPNTVAYHRDRLFQFLEWAGLQGFLNVPIAQASDIGTPADVLSRVQVGVDTEHTPALPIPSASDISAVYSSIAAHTRPSLVPRNMLMFRWATEAGLRNTELRTLTVKMLPSIGKVNLWAASGVTPVMRVKGKGGKTRIIEPPISLLQDTFDFLNEAVEKGSRPAWKAAGGHVFFKVGFAVLSRKYISDKMSWYFEVAGVDGHLHRGRAYYAYRLVEEKVRELARAGKLEELQVSTILRFVADRVGHADLVTLRHYVNMAVLSFQAGDPPILAA